MLKKITSSLTFLIFIIVLSSFTASPVAALKKRTYQTSGTKTTSAYPISVVSLSRAQNRLNINFSNLATITSASYELTYLSKGLEQGAYGTVKPAGVGTDTRSIYFGTCSKNACTPHTQITSARLSITYKLKSGKTYIKRYSIRY